ncbi:zinc-binding alcohol dehydrogenase [bacterium]|nr:dehydrogenase [Gemmatimonadota bacterium]MCH2664343.1 zinc-binding alcohol dehydrogenase [bacterium]HCK12271.1 dehydrogenase [Candidatus Latescibacterota bacterium]
MQIEQQQITFTAREMAELVSTTEEVELGPTQIAGHTVASLVSAGTELNGSYLADSFPKRPGYATVFKVEHIGSAVEDVSVGELRFCMGNHKSFQVTEAKNSLPVPEGLDPAVATYARLMGVTMTTLVTTTARPPDVVVVTGLGPVGNLGAQNFTTNGYSVIGCDPDDQRRELASRLGIGETVAHVADASRAGDVALLIDCSGHEAAILDGAKVVRQLGEVVCVGAPWARRSERFAHDLHHTIFFNYITVRSGWEWEIPRHPDDFRHRSIWGNLATALQWLNEGRVRVNGLGLRTTPTAAQDAYQSLLHQKCECPTVLFDWGAL